MFCKHLVAAVLSAREVAEDEDSAIDDEATVEPAAKRPARDNLLDFLRAQPAPRLAGWLKALADEDADIDKRLRLYRAADDPATLKTALAKILSTGGFLDWRRSMAYARRLDTAIEQIGAQLARHAGACRALCEYALGRLFKIYERSDDSSGAIGDRLRDLAELHAEACALEPPGKALAKPLFALQRRDDWGMLPLAEYWQALRADGQHAYGKLIAAEIEELPTKSEEKDRYGETFGICRRAEAYARCAGEFELLQRVLRRDLSKPYDHQRVIESLREYGKEREALAFAEDAVKRFPQDLRLREALAECLRSAGLGDEALEQSWRAFALRPGSDTWDGLKRFAGPAWMQWRERALAQIAAAERGDATLRVRLLMHDGDVAAAVALARTQPVWPDTLQELAERIAREDAATAGEFYLRMAHYQSERLDYASYPKMVALLKRASKLLPAGVWQPAVTEQRALHAKKTRYMALLAEAGL